MTYRLLCLDAGFTLLTPRRTLADALSGVLAEDGHAITDEELRSAWEQADRTFWDEYHRPGNDTWTDDGRIEEYWRGYHRIMLGKLGVEARREMLDRVLASQWAADAWEPYPDVEPMLSEFVQQDWRWSFHLAVATGEHHQMDLSFVECPVTLLAGRHDVLTSMHDIVEAAERIPHAQITVLPGSHFLPMEYPELVTAALGELARRCDLEPQRGPDPVGTAENGEALA